MRQLTFFMLEVHLNGDSDSTKDPDDPEVPIYDSSRGVVHMVSRMLGSLRSRGESQVKN